jgi:hypothetical protein
MFTLHCCPVFGAHYKITGLSQEFDEVDAALQSSKNQYNALIDGGNQGQLLSNIRTTWSRDTALLRRSLLALSPNLSAHILTVVAQLNSLSNASLMQLLLANPSSCKNQRLINVLQQELRTPFTDAQIRSLLSVSNQGSRRYELEETMNEKGSRRGELGWMIIRGLIKDQDGNKEQLRQWWNRIGTQHAQYNLAESFITDNQSNRYEAQLRALERDLSYSDLYVTENNDYIKLYNLKSKVLKSGRSWKQLTNDELQQVRQIANNTNGDAAVQANNLLCFAIGECKKLVIPRLSSDGTIGLRTQPNNATLTNTNKPAGNFTVYPNPAKTNLTVNFVLSETIGEAYAIMVDFTGREVKRQKLNAQQSQIQWQTDQLQTGLYFVSIVADNKTVWQTKVSIQK